MPLAGATEAAGCAGLRLGDAVEVVGADPVLPTGFAIGEAAAVALAEVGEAVNELRTTVGARPVGGRVEVRQAAATLVGFGVQRLDGAPTPRTNQSNPLVRLHRTGDDRWIHLHGGFPALAEGTARVLGLGGREPTFESVGEVVAGWSALALEDALADAGQCGAMVRAESEWLAHPHGSVVSALPLVRASATDEAPEEPVVGAAGSRPLAGVRVVDLTRVLAGPTCGRTLAFLGADVLNVRAAHLPHVPAFVLDTGHGKRSAFLDLGRPDDRATLDELIASADVVARGYRPGSLERRGLGVDDLVARRPGLVVATISAYGPDGPWATRPGWEQLAQSASGIAARHGSPERPALLPAAATDYTTGLLAAGGIVRALANRARGEGGRHVEASLCQTAAWLLRRGADLSASAATGLGELPLIETDSAHGRLRHLGPALELDGLDLAWRLPPPRLGEHAAVWAN